MPRWKMDSVKASKPWLLEMEWHIYGLKLRKSLYRGLSCHEFKFPPDFKEAKPKQLTDASVLSNKSSTRKAIKKKPLQPKFWYLKNLNGSHFCSHCYSTHRSCTGWMYSFLNLFSSALRGWSPFSIAIRSASVGSGSGISNLAQEMGVSTNHITYYTNLAHMNKWW